MPAKPVGAPKKTVGLMPPTPPSQRLKMASGVGRSAISSVGRAHAQREGQRVAQAVGEEQLGGGEADVALASGRARALPYSSAVQ